ncbi:MerR family transcriptional regulator [Jatrophihabitans sp.]|uniref:MerR family transcriptional regulator n=1 Tax=Jatrophihabitans sp. TaxID=1932789 RepID=UPI0038CD6F6D
MSWSIVEVARMSGVSSRALRHYDEIGLLPPSHIGANGYRHYEQAELLRLQQILLLRELGLGLAEIAGILDSQLDQVQALREHHQRLLRERDRLGVLARTVARTIDQLDAQASADAQARTDAHASADAQARTDVEARTAMTEINRPENLFEGFDPSAYEQEARQRWPQEWEQSARFTATLTPQDIERMQREMTAAMIRMAELMAAGTPVEDADVQAEVDAAYQAVCRFWTPDAAAFTNLGRMYVEDERFKATYDRIADGLAEFYRDAMACYADTTLS